VSAEETNSISVDAPLGQLERALTDQYLRARGYDAARLDALPEPERETLLKQAALHASGRLTEIEARSQFLHEVHEELPGVH
jgi:hypothetical protein